MRCMIIMKEIVLRCIQSWLKQRKILFLGMLYDIFVNIITAFLLFVTWEILIYSSKLLKIDFLYNKLFYLNKFIIFILIFWCCVSTIFILIKHIKFIHTAINIMEKRLNEEI